jgi:ribonucleoside-diphosphate reductase alpha chain
MFTRVAETLANVEKKYGRDGKFVSKTAKDFFNIMASKEYTPAGRTMTNAGAGTPIVANCIVLPIHDTMESIFQTLKDAALLQQAGSGLGFSLDEMRPAMTPTKRSHGVSSGPVSFLKVYNEAFGTIKQQGRHGANMAMMSVSHPDILDFIRAKEIEGEISNFNISVKVTDEFMKAIAERPNTQWYCEWNGAKTKPHKVLRAKNGSVVGVEDVDITVKELFDELVAYAWTNGEPGIVFIDEINRANPLPGLGDIAASNPCGEQFLHPYDNCNLGSINLSVFVENGKMDWNRLKWVTKTATRLMDNVIDLFDFPVPAITEMANRNRRIGLGIMGFADMLYQLGVAYNSEEGRKLAEKTMKTINDAAHEMSAQLAKEKGVFPNWDKSVFKKKNVKMRNAALTTVAPTGSISMMFDCSSGIEPNFALSFVKQDKDGLQYHYFNTYFDKALKKYKLSKAKLEEIKTELLRTGSIQGLSDLPAELRKTFVVAMDISAEDHMKMQAAFQRYVDNSISKTINFPNNATKEEVFDGFVAAWKNKCKSCTVYRDGSRSVQILNLGNGEGLTAPTEIGKEKSAPSPKKEESLLVDTSRHGAKLRPSVMNGRTYRVKTGYGNIYVTINNDERGEPFEVFATIGKSGGFFQEQSEGICRLVSLGLRSGLKVGEIIDNLKGIRGPMPTVSDRGTILSLPDAIGKILEEHVHQNDPSLIGSSIALPETVSVEVSQKADSFDSSVKSIADLGVMPGCPDCGSVLQIAEGCLSCKNCGFSRCG